MSDKQLPEDPKQVAKFLRIRATGHAPGYDIAVYGRPLVWLALAETLEAATERNPTDHKHQSNFTPFWQPPLGEKLLGITNYQDMVIVATDRMIYLIHEHGRSFDHTVIAAIAQKD